MSQSYRRSAHGFREAGKKKMYDFMYDHIREDHDDVLTLILRDAEEFAGHRMRSGLKSDE
jgi:hypothetical protein